MDFSKIVQAATASTEMNELMEKFRLSVENGIINREEAHKALSNIVLNSFIAYCSENDKKYHAFLTLSPADLQVNDVMINLEKLPEGDESNFNYEHASGAQVLQHIANKENFTVGANTSFDQKFQNGRLITKTKSYLKGRLLKMAVNNIEYMDQILGCKKRSKKTSSSSVSFNSHIELQFFLICNC